MKDPLNPQYKRGEELDKKREKVATDGWRSLKSPTDL
jgi:hypothetical protein